MTGISEKLKEIYRKYGEAEAAVRKKSFADAVSDLFSSKEKEIPQIDREFMEIVTEYAGRIAEEGDREDALAAAELILSLPRNKKFSESAVCYAAMHSNVRTLLPRLTDDDVKTVRGLAEQVPKQYRFPVYKDMINALDERLKNK